MKVQGNVWMITGAGAESIAMQAGKEGVLLVDTGAAGMTDKVLAAVREVSDGPIRYHRQHFDLRGSYWRQRCPGCTSRRPHKR